MDVRKPILINNIPVTARVRELMNEAINDGQGDLDSSSFLLLLEKLSNLQGKRP